jgi:lipopolysaccharide/colanic/teichoic acid biosynthesis glycosyltransferase
MAKRIFDIIVATMLLIILLPLLLIITLLILILSGRPVIFKQQRVGLYGKAFMMYKFRTMYNSNCNSSYITLHNDKRITTIGKILRSTKLDELPQIFNVIIGNMSVVGPRPEVQQYVDLYPDTIKEIILSVKPGITDWASLLMFNESRLLVNANNANAKYIEIILPQKLQYAVKYVKQHNVLIDCYIIILTIKRLLHL